MALWESTSTSIDGSVTSSENNSLSIDEMGTAQPSDNYFDENDTTEDSKIRRYHHVLPPCKVCGTQATGFHYGINSCEACKGFFRRSIIRKKDYRCSNNSKCLLKPGKHKLCPFCRFKRCLAVGMSVKGIKTGRYTYAKRTKDIMELKMMEQPEPVTEGADMDGDETTLFMNQAEEVRILADGLFEEMQGFSGDSQEVERKQKLYVRDENCTYNGLDVESLVMARNSIHSSTETNQESPVWNNNLETENTNMTVEETEKFFGSSQRERNLNDKGQAENSSETDNRKGIKLAWFRTIEFGIRCLVRFIKAIPGFKNLHMDDQLNLIKHSFLEAWLIARHKAFNTGKMVYTAANGFTLDIGLTCTREMFSIVLRTVKRLQALGLNGEETYVLQAVVQLFPDRCEMRNHQQVENLQSHYLKILQCLLKVNHKGDKLILPRILGILTELRDITDVFYKTSSQTAGYLPMIKDSAPLLMEMVTTVHE